MNRVSTGELARINQAMAKAGADAAKKRREQEEQRKKYEEERQKAALEMSRIPNSGGSAWEQYRAAKAAGEVKNASEFIQKRDARNSAWNKIGADTLNDDMKALSNSIGAAYGDTLDTSKYYTQEQLNASSDQVKKIRDRLKALQDYYNTYGGSDEQKKAVGEQIKAYDSEIKFFGDLGAYYGQYSSPEAYETLYDNGLYAEKYQGKNYSDIQNALKSTTNDREKAWLEKNADSFMTAAEAQAEIDRIEKAMGTKNIAGQRWTTGFPKIENGKLVYNDNLYDKETGKRLQKLEAIRDSKINKETLESYGRYLGEANEFATERALFLAKQNNILQHGNETFGVFAPDAKAPYAKNENAQNEATRLSPEKLKAVNEQSGQAFSFLDNADWATDDEKKIYDYLLYYKGGEEAKKYLRALSYELNRRAANALDQTVSDMYDKASGLGKTVLNIGSLGMNIIGNPEAAIDTIAHRIVDERVDPNSNNQTFRRIRNVIREKTGADLAKASEGTIFGKELFGENAANMLYGAAMSSLDSLLGGFTFGEGYTAVMGGGAMADEAERLYNKGASDSQIFNRSFAAGLAEYITEKVSMDNLLKAKSPANGLQVAKEILKQAGIEGSEEMASDVLNLVADSIIMADRSEMSESIQKYKDGYIDDNGTYHKGVSEKEAQKLAWQDFFTDAMADGLAGALSGGMMSAGPTISSYKYSKNRAAIQIPSIDPGNAEGLVSNARINDISVLTDVSEALKNGDAEEAGGVISEGIAWYEFLRKYGEKTYGKNQWSEVRGSIDDSISKLKKIQKLVADGSIDAAAIDEVLKTAETSMKTTPTVDVTSANDEKLFSLLAKGEPSNSVIEKNILKDRGTLAAFERLTGLRIGGTTVSQKRADVREAFKAVSSSTETLKAAQNAIESGATATEGHKNAAVIIDQAIQANRAENSRLRNSEKVKSAETKAAIDATNRQHRFLETVRNYVINGGDLSGFTESPASNVFGEGGTNSSETKTTQETVKKRVRADFSAYQDEITATEYNKAVKGSAAEQYTYFSNEEKKLNSDIKNIAESEAMTAEEKAEAIEKKNEEKNRLYALAKSTENVREMMRVKYAGNVDRLVEELQPKLKKYGIKIDVVDNIDAAGKSSSGAYFDRNTNTIKVSRNWDNFNNVVKLVLAGEGLAVTDRASVSFDRAVTQTIAHEIAHADSGLTLDFIKAVAGTQYDAFDLKGRLEHPDDRSWRSEDAQKEKNWRRYVDAYTEQAMLEMKGTEEQRRASAEKVVNDAYIFEEIMADMFGAAVDDMGHSSKAGENIFWAMNRNKPGIIKRILNALERFIARIRGKDAYLAVEQRQAAERLRDMLTGELKRAYGTEVKGEAAVENDGGKRYSIVYLDDGKTYVTASRNVISGNDVNQWRKQITNFFNALLEGNKSIDIETVEGDTLTITKKETTRKARDNFKQENGKPVRMSDSEFRVKLNVEAHIDEIAETARSSKNTGSADTKSHAFAKDGFTYRTAYFEDFNGDYYRVRLSIGNNGTVATVYNVGKMTKDVPASAKILAVVGSKPLAVTSSDNSISQDSRNVNRQFSEISDAKTIEDGGTVENDSGEFVAESDGNGGTRWSLSTYESSGRETLRQYLGGQVSESGLTEADAKAVLDSMDDIYEICRKYEGEYVPFGAWSRAEVVIDEKGNPVFSVIKPNGEYAMNLDFSLVCKKRRALDAVLNRLIETGAINDFGFGQEEIVRANEIIREHGFEIACDMCFVDAKRYRQAGVADQFVDLYNSIVKSMAKDGQEIDYFNFANDSSLSHTEGGIDRLSDAELDFSEINEITKPGAKKTMAYRVAQYLKTHPADRKLLSRGDFMSTAGFDAVKASKPDILKIYNVKKGAGGPKAAQSDVQYLNDILSSKKFNRSAAYDVGGVRVQSFSDYVPRLVFDYVQMIGDLAAKRLPAHAYTKEPLFAKQFGLTGMKINMSLMPAKGNGKYAGLNADGSYAWARKSFPAEEAFRIQADPEYGKNVGTIAVGISDEHIWKMLSDPDIRMVIPYHKSGINPAVAVKLKIGEYTDYTGQQNTVRRDGRQLTKAELKNIPDINRLMHRDGLDAVEASRRYVEWCEDNGYIPKFEKFAYMTDSDGSRVFNENYYKLLEDFTTMVDGEFHPQGDVTATFPGSDSAFGSMADLIKEGLEEDAVTANRLNGEVDGLAEEIRSALGREERGKRFSLTRANGITTEITDDSYDEYEGGYQRRDIKLNGETVGTVAIRIYDDYSEIDRIDIDEKYRNKGIGTTVLGDIAGEFDTTYIVPDNESAKRLYERIGEEVTSGEVYENLDQGYGVYRLDKSYGNTRWSLAGTNKDGIEVYETSEKVMNMSEDERKRLSLDMFKNDYRGKTARFYKNGHYYYAQMSPDDARKALYGDRRSSRRGAKALVRTIADGSFFDLIENAEYDRGAIEQGKNTKAHKDVIAWDYFIKTVQIDNRVYDLTADIKKKANGEYVYTLHLTDSNKKAAPAQSRFSGFAKVAETASVDNSVSQNTPDVNSQYMREGEKDSSSERHSLVKSAQSETETIEAEDKAIKNVLEKFSKERYYKSGYPYKFNEFLNRVADLSETSGERIPREQLLDTVKRLFRYAYENRLDGKALGRDYRHDTDIFAAMVGDIENEIYDWVSPLRDEYNEARDAKKKLRTEKIFVPTEIRASVAEAAGFETWSDFRKSLFGIVGLVNEQKGRALSEVYAELSEIYPEYFPDNITDGTEQAVLIADLARNMRVNGIGESNVLSYEEQLVKKSIGRAISELLYNGENTVSINAMRKRIAQLKEQREKAITSLKEKYAEQFKNRSEKQKQTVLRNKVLRKYTEASSTLSRPTTENHFTEAMRKPLMEFLAAVDITTGKSVAKQGVYDRILRVIEAANNMAAEDGKNGLDIAETDLNVQEKQLIVDSGLLERMSAWVEANKGKKLTELSSAQLEELNGIFNQLKHLTAEIKRLYDPREGLAAKSWQAQKEIGLAQTKEREQVLGAKTEKAREKYEQIHFGALDAAGYYNTLGSDTMTAQFERFRQCQNRFSENIQMFTDRLGEIVDGAIPKDEHGKNAKEVTLKLSHGTLTATPAQLMSIHLMLNQEDSRRCLFNEAGGVIIGKFTAEKPKDGKAHISGKRTFAQSGRLVLNEADAAKITAALTDGQRKRADEISALLNNEAARLGNEVSMAMYGYKKYTTENYFPMRTADDYRAIADNPNYEMNLLGLSFTKERTGRAGKALVAEDIYDVIGRHLTNMAQYNAFAQELDNAKKMYSLRLGDGTSLKQRIIRSYGREADAFYNKLINNLSGVQMYTNNSAEALSDKLLSNYKAAAVAGNVSVVLKQPMSIFRALPEFSLAGLKKSMAFEDILNLSPKQLKANTAEMLKYSGIARLKAWGSSENMTRKSFESLYNDNSDTARQKINEFLTSGAENADMWTWAKLWRMSKAEIDAQGKYTAGSKEYFEAVDRKFSDVIGKTQVVQSALDSSMAVQNAKGFGKFLFAFQNEPLKQYSYLISTLNDARRGKPGAKKKLAKVIASSLANTAAVSAISTFMAWLRGTLDRDDDDELIDDLMNEFAGNAKDDILSGAFAPVWQYIDTIMGAIRAGVYGNTVERLDMAALTDLGGLINKYFISQNGGRPNLGTVQDIVNVASNLFGLPAKNIFRDVKSVIDRIILELPVPSAAKYNYLKAWKDVELTNKAAVTEAYYDVLRDAVDRGRYSDYVKIKRDMIYHGYTETKIKNAVMKSSLMDDLYELKKVNPGSYKAKVNSIVSSVSAVSSLEGKEFEDFIESAMKRREREDGGSKTDDEVYDDMHRKMEKEVKEQLIYIDVSKRAAYIKRMLKTYGEYGITEADILKVLRKAGKA
nr:MAG TPA: acetyltransferase domain containing protein [Caudoviricetes sp.]